MGARQFANLMHQRPGQTALLIVITLGSVGMGLALWIATGSSWNFQRVTGDRSSVQARQLANACAEVALETIRENSAYTGTGTQIIGQQTCTYTVANTGGTTRLITAASTIYSVTRRISITISAVNPVTTSTWQEIP